MKVQGQREDGSLGLVVRDYDLEEGIPHVLAQAKRFAQALERPVHLKCNGTPIAVSMSSDLDRIHARYLEVRENGQESEQVGPEDTSE